MRGTAGGNIEPGRITRSVRARVAIMGAVPATIALVAGGNAAIQAHQASVVSNAQQSASGEAEIETRVHSEILAPPEPAQTEFYESVTTSPDQQSETRRYSATTQYENGNTSSQQHTVTTNIDGNSAVDVSLKSNSTSSESSSSTSVRLDVSSSSSVRSSSGP